VYSTGRLPAVVVRVNVTHPGKGVPALEAAGTAAFTVTTGWAAIVSLTPVLAVVLLVRAVSGGEETTGAALRVGLAGWLLAHGVPLHAGNGTVGLAPLTVTALAGWRVVRAGVHTTRAIGGRRRGDWRPAILAACAVAVAYGLLGTAAAALASTPGVRVPVLRAGLTLAGFGLAAGLAGALRESGVYRVLAGRVPPLVRDALRTGLMSGGGCRPSGVRARRCAPGGRRCRWPPRSPPVGRRSCR